MINCAGLFVFSDENTSDKKAGNDKKLADPNHGQPAQLFVIDSVLYEGAKIMGENNAYTAQSPQEVYAFHSPFIPGRTAKRNRKQLHERHDNKARIERNEGTSKQIEVCSTDYDR